MVRKSTLVSSSILLLLLVLLVSLLVSCITGERKPTNRADEKLLFQKKEAFGAGLIDRGHYIVTISGCNDCHSPKKFTPEGSFLDSGKLLSGHPAQSLLPPIDTRGFKLGYWKLFSPDLTAYLGDWGITFSANLTPDSTTGIGAWTENNFMKAIRTGRHLGQDGGRRILPPMPWAKFAKMTDEDLKSIYAYLRTIPPIHNKVPAPIPPFKKGGKN